MNIIDMKEHYNEVTKRRTEIIAQIEHLKENEIIKKYLELKKENDSLYDKQMKLYRNICLEKYASCNHILVNSKIIYDEYDGRTRIYSGCIKCGLDNSVLCEQGVVVPYANKIMVEFLKKHYLNGVDTGLICNIDLATSIYSRIMEAHPNIDDKLAIKYFKAALHNIRKKTVSEERQVARANRLSLYPTFKNWNIK